MQLLLTLTIKQDLVQRLPEEVLAETAEHVFAVCLVKDLDHLRLLQELKANEQHLVRTDSGQGLDFLQGSELKFLAQNDRSFQNNDAGDA